MVKPSQSLLRKDPTRSSGTNSAVRRPLPDSQMDAVLLVVTNILREQPLPMTFLHRQDVIQQVSPAALDPTLHNAVLPGTLEGGADRAGLQGSNRCGDFQPIRGIPAEDDKPGCRPRWKRLPELLHDPTARRVLGDVEVQDASTVVTDDEEAVEQAERDRWQGEKVHRGNRFPVVSQKRKPTLDWLGISRPIQGEMVRSETSRPSRSSSPWIRGAPHVGFSATIRKIRSRTSFETHLLPCDSQTRKIRHQGKPKPARCHRTTVSGVTTRRNCFHSDQNRRAATQNHFSHGAQAWAWMAPLLYDQLLA